MSTPPPPKRPTSSHPPRPSLMTPPEKPKGTRSLIEEIVAEQKQQKVDVKAAMEKRDKRFKFAPIAAGILIAANVVAWVIIPPKGDGRTTRRNSLEIERDLRLVIASAASEVDIWRRLHDNKMPATLSEVGVPDSGLVIANVDGTVYEIRGADHGIKLSYRSNTSITDFLDAGLAGTKK